MKRKCIMAMLTLSMLLGACGRDISGGEGNEVSAPRTGSGATVNYTENAGTLDVPDGQIGEEQTAALAQSSMALFAQSVAESGEGENVLVSPTSIITAFGMTENGAEKATLSQMEQVINGGISVDEMNPLLCDLADRFNSSKDVRWNVANSIWFKDDGRMRVNPDFAAKALSYYGADIWGAPFDESTVKDINNWVNDETRGMIPEVIDDLDEDARMCLINAIAFEGEWENKYRESDIQKNCDFTNADGSRSEVTLLHSEEDGYFTLGNGTGFVRPYKGGEYSFVGILPDEGITATDYVAALAENGAAFTDAVQNLNYDRDVYVWIPEFTTDYENEMSGMLTTMGMPDAFDQERAEFGAMMEPTDPSEVWDIWIGSVIHKTHIEVDREGTRAAAVTAVTMEAVCTAVAEYEPPVCISLDRPFVYAIVDNETGLPVFLGCMNTME